jgi:L-ascorbate metabolism protein UlaG (beta-lactamase superfamily)
MIPFGRAFWRGLLALAFAALLAGAPASAEGRGPTASQAQQCPRLVATTPDHLATTLEPAALSQADVRLTFIGHSTFLIESPGLVRIATDYNDGMKPALLPDIVTMNHAHATHYTDHPDPAIKLVLRGWGSEGVPAMHDLTYKDVRVRNVPTNIRDGSGGTERYGNSIFIFEVANLCIAHLGHLHHTLTQQQLDDIGSVDVVMAPVDGSYTLDLEGIIEVLAGLKSKLIIPMHYFSMSSLGRFLNRAKAHWPVAINETPSVVLAGPMWPAPPRLLVLPGH